VLAHETFSRIVKENGMELVSMPINGPTEVADAAQALCQSGVDLVCQLSDNLTNSSFPAIGRACEMAKMPLFSFAAVQIRNGATLAVGSDYTDNGRQTGLVVAEVIRGKDPTNMPFHASDRIRRSVNLDTARRLGITIPNSWVEKADEVLPGRPAKAP
jgi:putative ABC transport system substrate-binding protein